MMSLSSFRKNLFKTFDLMRDTKLTIDVYHRRKVYRLNVEETGQKVQTPYKRKAPKVVIPNTLIKTTECKECGSLLVNNICMNVSCPSNEKTPN